MMRFSARDDGSSAFSRLALLEGGERLNTTLFQSFGPAGALVQERAELKR